MKEIALTRSKAAFVDEIDYAFLTQWRWYYGANGYAVRSYRKDGKIRRLYMHLSIAERMGLAITDEVDHIDKCKLTNTRENLRPASRSQSQHTRSSDNKTGYRGVREIRSKSRIRYQAQIMKNGHFYHLGCYATPEAAAKQYDCWAERLYGDFATLNFPKAI
jgi:hypothetical protein